MRRYFEDAGITVFRLTITITQSGEVFREP